MGLRFRKSIKIAPGIKVNLGTKGVGLSVGTKDCHYSINSSCRRTTTIIVHATDLVVDSATGRDTEPTILSVRFERNGLQNIDFLHIDASDFTESFQHNMNFKKIPAFARLIE